MTSWLLAYPEIPRQAASESAERLSVRLDHASGFSKQLAATQWAGFSWSGSYSILSGAMGSH